GGDLLGRQDHHIGQSLHLPHFAALGRRSGRLRQDRRQAPHRQGRLPRREQRLGARRRGRFRQDVQGAQHQSRPDRDHGSAGTGHERSARQDQSLRRRHADRHHGGRAAHADLQAGGGAGFEEANHYYGWVAESGSVDRTGRRGSKRHHAHHLLHAV